MPDGGRHPLREPQARYEAGFPNEHNPSPPPGQPGDVEIYCAGQRLRDWARYLAKNSSIVKAVLDARQTKGIGTGLSYEPMVRDRKGHLLPRLNDAIRHWHERWSQAADVTGELSRQELELKVWREWDTAGELFARKVYRGRTVERLGYQLQLLRSELVPYGFMHRSGPISGIERDDWGAPLQYWVYPQHPHSGWGLGARGLVPKPIPARAVLHLRRQDGDLDSTRGVTLFHAVIFRVSDIAEYQQAHRRAARASASLFASINRSPDFPPDPDAPDRGQDALSLNDLTLLDYLQPGESVNFHTPQHPNQNAIDFVNQELRQLASACRVAFSWIAYVFDRAYAAQRTELIHAWEFIAEDRAHYIRDFARPGLYVEPLRVAVLEGRLPARELRKADPQTLYDVRIEGPAMPTIDPVKDRDAARIDYDMGWDSRPAIIRRFGRLPVQVDLEREQDTFVPAADLPRDLTADEEDDSTSSDDRDTREGSDA